MNSAFDHAELARLMKETAGISADPMEMESRPDATFADFGLDSLGLMAVVAEIEHGYSVPLGPDAERCKSPHEFVALVNSQLTSGV
ncbi:acyl carrier protein [Yinghuangia seranimata]|uniref:acyl carrier protein n=1 Tax=Yinghuangia seranimata TaxID=408067 RepID=UPI00248D2A2E|nr:acyl carrier protein [Yinghuangia seranimata]MDI2128993.1 acyl carrier protein [Yinghuangia seranimata]